MTDDKQVWSTFCRNGCNKRILETYDDILTLSFCPECGKKVYGWTLWLDHEAVLQRRIAVLTEELAAHTSGYYCPQCGKPTITGAYCSEACLLGIDTNEDA